MNPTAETESSVPLITPRGNTKWESATSTTRGNAESLKKRLTANDIIAISDHPLDSIIQISRGSGYSQFGGLPIPIRSTYALHWDQYQARENMDWPEGPVSDSQSIQEHDAERDRVASKSFAEELMKLGEEGT